MRDRDSVAAAPNGAPTLSPSPLARTARRLRSLHFLPLWHRLVERLVPEDAERAFLIQNDGLWFKGAMDSFIERQTYLFGQYEAPFITAFLAAIPADRRGCILDVGANVGTHSLAFAKAFAEVHAFEPNPHVFHKLLENLKLNPSLDVSAHMVGLSNTSAVLDFYLTEKENLGLGTFSTVEQYDVPLIKAGTARVERGDDFLKDRLRRKVDAVKIDVQGFEPDVLLGLRNLLAKDRPYVWFEVTEPTLAKFSDQAALSAYFPYKIMLSKFGAQRGESPLCPWNRDALVRGDFLASPAD
ncbi:MAG: FkbM family methyltransferase [Sphingomicrobium sp.]